MLKIVAITIIAYEVSCLYIENFDHSVFAYRIKQFIAYIISLETILLVINYKAFFLFIIVAAIFWFRKSEEARSEFYYYLEEFSNEADVNEENEES